MQSAENTRFCNFKTRFSSQEEFLDHFGGQQKKNKWYADLYDWLENKFDYIYIKWTFSKQTENNNSNWTDPRWNRKFIYQISFQN